MAVQELVLEEGPCHGAGRIVKVARPTGQNDVGVVAWLMTLKPPEAPQGRQVK